MESIRNRHILVAKKWVFLPICAALLTSGYASAEDYKVNWEDAAVCLKCSRFLDVYIDSLIQMTGEWIGEISAEYINSSLEGRASIEDSIFYNMECGFSIGLSEGEARGERYKIIVTGTNKELSLTCYGYEGNERYSVHMKSSEEAYNFYSAFYNAVDLGEWMQRSFDDATRKYGYDEINRAYIVEKAEDINLDGKNAMKFVVRTEEGPMTNGALLIRYLILDKEHNRSIDLSQTFFAETESEENREAYQTFVESLKWIDTQHLNEP